MLNKAILIATQAHEGVTRKDSGLPYIVHPLGVMQILIEEGIEDEYILSMAVLHDVIEDCATAYHLEIFDLSKDLFEDISYLSKGKTKEETLEKLSSASLYAQFVKLADIMHNCRDGELYKGYYAKKLEQLEVMTKVHFTDLYRKVKELLENKS